MQWVAYLIFTAFVISMGGAPVFAQALQQFNVIDPQSGQSYPVKYSITGGSIGDMAINQNETSLVVSMNTTGSGNLTMTLPRTLIDAKSGSADDQFFVLVDGADTNFNETKTSTDRTITVSFPDGTQQLEVIGTEVVPEFGILSFAVLGISIISIVTVSARTKLKLVE